MLTFASNIDEIIAELERQKADIGANLIPAVMQPEAYLPELERVARTVLAGLATEEQSGFIDGLVASIMAAAETGGMSFEMFETGEDGGTPFDPSNPEKSYQEILQWVSEFKDKTSEQDTYAGGRGRERGEWMTNEAIAARIVRIIKRDPSIFFHGSKDPSSLENFLNGLTGQGGGKVSELLVAVLEAWHDIMGVRVVEAAMAKLDAQLT